MTRSIGIPRPDCGARHAEARARGQALDPLGARRGAGLTEPNGEETQMGDHAANFHKSLPHDANGAVHRPSYCAMVAALTGQDAGALETLPVGRNRTAAGTETDPPRYTATVPLGFRKPTSPMTGHVFDTQGADAGALAISASPALGSDEVAAEMAELYVMALCRDATFADIAQGAAPANLGAPVGALGGMSWFDGSFPPTTEAERRRFESRGLLNSASDLFRGSTPGSKTGPWLSQFMLIGNTNTGFTFQRPNGTPAPGNSAQPSFPGIRSNISIEDGFILYGTQVIDQRSIVAIPGRDYMTNWAAWLDFQNGVDLNNFDIFMHHRRYLTTPRDIATYVHHDALYQAYLNACLIILADGGNFPKAPGLPGTRRRRSGVQSEGPPGVRPVSAGASTSSERFRSSIPGEHIRATGLGNPVPCSDRFGSRANRPHRRSVSRVP